MTSYAYDALDNRVQKVDGSATVASVSYLLDPFDPSGLPQVLRESDAAATPTADYIYGPDLISMRSAGGAQFYLHDGQRSTRLLTDSAGTRTDTYDYDAFGNLLARTGSTPNTYLYNGQQFEPSLGAYYLQARYFAPTVGRFLTTDPLAGSISDPLSLHRYICASDDPVNRSDPSGKQDLVTTMGTLTGFANVSANLSLATGAAVLVSALAVTCAGNFLISTVAASSGVPVNTRVPCTNGLNEMQIQVDGSMSRLFPRPGFTLRMLQPDKPFGVTSSLVLLRVQFLIARGILPSSAWAAFYMPVTDRELLGGVAGEQPRSRWASS